MRREGLGAPCSGIAGLPGFEASLRLLVERERYSHTDIALMFGVSRERIRQLLERHAITHPDGRTVGLFAVRVWDDATNRFRPVSRGEISVAKEAGARAVARARRARRKAERRERVIASIVALRQSLGRTPSWREMYLALGGNPAQPYNGSAAIVLALWVDDRTTGYRGALRAFKKATGMQPRASGYRGHLRPRTRRENCECGERIHEYACGIRRCLACHNRKMHSKRLASRLDAERAREPGSPSDALRSHSNHKTLTSEV